MLVTRSSPADASGATTEHPLPGRSQAACQADDLGYG